MQDLLNDKLYPALFERLDTALPEFHFKRKAKGNGLQLWESRAALRPDGHQGKEAGKTFVSERTPFYLSDLNPIRGRSIWAYIKERDNLDNAGTFRRLCELAEIDPKAGLSPEALQRIEEAQRRAEVFEAANAFYLEQLHQAKSAAADAAREYLKKRGYKLAELRQPEQELKDTYTGGERMEIGYCPNLPDLERYLKEQPRFSPEEIKKVLPPNGAAGRVSLALRERGRIVGFIFRAVGDQVPKYLALEGYNRENHLPGLTRSESLVLVEGYLDAAHAHAAGFTNFATLGGVSLSEAQIEAALRAGVRSFALALDNDQAGQKATRAAVETLLRYQEKAGKDFDVFVCQYPDGCKDFDELLSLPDGASAAADMIGKGKVGAARYLVSWLDKTRAEEIASEAGGYGNDTFRAALIRELILLERLLRAVDVPQFRQYVEPFYKTWGIDGEAIAAAADTVRELEAEKQYRAELRALSKKAAEALDAGKTEEAESLLWNETREARLRLHSGRFAGLLHGHTKEAVAAELARLGGALATRYELYHKDKEPVKLEFPAGAISVIAAPSSHGKTAFLINSILDLCDLHPEKEFHFFTLEESAAAVSAKMLNTFLDMDLSSRNERSLEHYLKGDPQYIRGGILSEMREKEAGFWTRLGSRFFIHYLEENTAEQLCEAVQWLHRRRNIGGVFVDYIQLINLANPGRLARHEEMKQVCVQLKNTAVDTGLPLVFAAQFSRQADNEYDTHDYKNIGEAGDIERVAALIVGLWNREFNEPKPIKDNKGNITGYTNEPAPIMAAKILKWRGGPVGHAAQWNYNGNRKRIYPDAITSGAGRNLAPAGNPFLNS